MTLNHIVMFYFSRWFFLSFLIRLIKHTRVVVLKTKKNKMSSSSKYEIRLMIKNDYEQVLSLLINSFFKDEPLTRNLQVTDVSHFSNNVIKTCLNDQCSFVAYDTETNQIVGVCLNEIVDRDTKNENNQPDEKLNFLLQIFADMHKKINIFDRLNADKLLHIFMISVDKIARGHRLAACLIGKSIEHAKNLNITGAFAEATSVYSLNCFKQHGFQIIDELIYAGYNPEYLGNMNDKMYDRCYLVARTINKD